MGFLTNAAEGVVALTQYAINRLVGEVPSTATPGSNGVLYLQVPEADDDDDGNSDPASPTAADGGANNGSKVYNPRTNRFETQSPTWAQEMYLNGNPDNLPNPLINAAFAVNGFMADSIGDLLPQSYHFALIRGTGTHGDAMLERLADRGSVGVSVRRDGGSHIPCSTLYPTLLHRGCETVTVSLRHVPDHRQLLATLDSIASEDGCSMDVCTLRIAGALTSLETVSHLVKDLDPLTLELTRDISFTNWEEGAVDESELTEMRMPVREECRVVPRFFLTALKLQSISIASFDSVTTISESFLAQCTELREVDLRSLTNVKTIGRRFLADCTQLGAVDLTPLSSVVSVGEGFLADCSSLEVVDFTGMRSLREVGPQLLARCKSLMSVELSGLCRVTEIPDCVLCECVNLQAVDLTHLAKVTRIGEFFLAGCRVLRSVDCRPLTAVVSIGRGFVRSCPVRELDLVPVRHAICV